MNDHLRRPAFGTPFDLPLAVFGLSAVMGLWIAYDGRSAWPRFGLIAAGIFVFYAVSTARRLGASLVWLPPLLGVALVVYFVQTNDWNAYPAKLAALTRLGQAVQLQLFARLGRHLNSNEVGGILAMTLPFAVLVASRAWQAVLRCLRPCPARRWLRLGAWLVLAAVLLFGLVVTTSRGAWIGLAVALLIAGWWVISARLLRRGHTRLMWILNGALLVALVTGIGAIILWPARLLAVPAALPGPDTWSGRLEFQRNSLMLIRDYPFTGAGLGGFQMLYSTYVLLIHVGYVPHSHNLFLNVALDQGLPGLLALVWAWLLFAVVVWRSWRRHAAGSLSGPDFAELGAATLALIVVLVHGLADNALYGTPGAALLFLPLAFAVPVADRVAAAGPEERRRRIIGWAAGVGLVLMPAVVYHGQLLSSIYSNLGAVHQTRAELSVYAWPEWPLQDAVRRAVDLGRPVSEFDRALALDPGNATANRRLGMIELSLGEYGQALDHLQAAFRAEPWSRTTRQLLGEALIVNGRRDEGQELWAGLSNDLHQLEARVFWYEHIGDPERAAWLRQAMNGR